MNLLHYTDGDALLSILKNQELWLTHIKYMTDSSEYINGAMVMKDKVAAIDDDSEYADFVGTLKTEWDTADNLGLYVCSFSSIPDLASQWRTYGHYAVEFDSDFVEGYCHGVDSLYECIYSKEKKEKSARIYSNEIHECYLAFKEVQARKPVKSFASFLKTKNMNTTVKKVLYEAARFKSESYTAEREWRLIVSENDKSIHSVTSERKPFELKFRCRSGLIMPYTLLKFPAEAIKKIWIGPMPGKDVQDLAENTIEMLLKEYSADPNNEFSRLKQLPVVEKSKVPY